MVDKSPAYAGLGIPEYWRFDETGEFHGTLLDGDALVEGRYEPIPIETVAEGVLQGYSRVLNLLIRWEHGQLGWHDPETGQHIVRYEDPPGPRRYSRGPCPGTGGGTGAAREGLTIRGTDPEPLPQGPAS